MSKELFYQAILKFILGAAVIAILLFLPAGTFYFWNAWVLMGILFILRENVTIQYLHSYEHQAMQKSLRDWLDA